MREGGSEGVREEGKVGEERETPCLLANSVSRRLSPRPHHLNQFGSVGGGELAGQLETASSRW